MVILIAGKPEYLQFEPHVGMKMMQVLGPPVYICEANIVLSSGVKSLISKSGGGKTSELLCNEPWRINTGNMDDSVPQYTHSRVNALNRTTDLLLSDRTI